MTDREMLELAAKAYWADEIDDVVYIKWIDSDGCIEFTHGDNQDHNGRDVGVLWNPLTDDGDALRLAVTLSFIDDGDWPAVTNEIYTHCNGDWFAATRRAITIAAAKVGKGMK